MEQNTKLSQLLSKRVVIGDGAMGTMLYSKGVFVNTCFDELNITRPSLIKDIHEQYVSAGADFIETNTFGANEYKLAKFGLFDKVEQINASAVKIAKEAAGKNALVAGAIGPIGIEGSAKLSVKQIIEIFERQIKSLADAGADFLLFETFGNLAELLLAVRAAGSVCGLEVVAQLSVNENKETLFGDRLDEAIIELCRCSHVAAAGLNCLLGPAAMLDCLDVLKTVATKPISIQPNAGLPQTVDGRTLYMSTPEYMAEYAKRFYQRGARIIGGCCGSTPEHIRQIAQAVKSIDKSERPPAIEVRQVEKAVRQIPVELKDKSQFGAKLAAGQKIITIEISPPKGADLSGLIEKVNLCKQAGVDAVNIPDGPRASSRISAMITAIKLQQACGIETLLHFCCRDRNIIAMQSDLLGIHTIGLRNVLIITGDPPKLGEYPNATGVFDLDSTALTKVVSDLNCGLDIAGNGFTPKTALVVGVGANPVAAEMKRELERFKKKIAAGAEFAITQPVFDSKSLFDFLDAADCRIPVIAGIWPFTSFKNAEFMANEVPGVVVPKNILDRMATAKDQLQSKKLGVQIAKELMEQIKDRVAGFAISAPFGNVKMALAAADKFDIQLG